MKRLGSIGLLVIITILAVYTLATIVHDSFLPQVHDPILYQKTGPIVRLVMKNKTYCSGTVVSPAVIITAAHCIAFQTDFGPIVNQGPIEIRGEDDIDRGARAFVNYYTPQMDQALLVGDFHMFEYKHIHTDPDILSSLAQADKMFTSCGYPLGGDLYCTTEKYLNRENFFWTMDGVLIPGMSGGPMMLPDGSLVGVNVAVTGRNAIVSPIYNLTKNLVKVHK